MKIALSGPLVAWLAVLALAGGGGARARAASSSVASTPVDVEIAIDGTASMSDAVARAANQATQLTTGAKGLLPDIHFAVVVFRDRTASLGEYQLLQPFTADAARVKDAINRVKANPHPIVPGPESYNLAFQRSYSDDRTGWRPSARKIVVVLGDAEPYGAGKAGLPGCRDQSTDPDGLSTPQELARMRAAERTLLMVRMHSSALAVSLQCYQSLAAGAFVGGTARDEGGNLAAIIVELIEHAYAPVTVTPDLRLALRSGRAGYTLTLNNPNVLPVTTHSVSLVLPRTGFRYVRGTTTGMTTSDPVQSGRTLRWTFNQTLSPRQKVRLHVVVRAPRRLGMYRSSALAQIQTAGGSILTSRAPSAVLRVKRGIRALTLRFTGSEATGTTLRGAAASRFSRSVRTVPAAARARGALVFLGGRQTRVVLRVKSLRLEKFAAPTRARLALRVVAARGLRHCSIGSRATLLLKDSAALRADGNTSDSMVLTLPSACGGRRLLTTAAVGVSAG
jgi:von Willebrand factor type A domain